GQAARFGTSTSTARGASSMDQRWERLRVSLLRNVEVAEGQREFAGLAATLNARLACACARDVISCAQQDKQCAEKTSRILLSVWHERTVLRASVGAVLMLCLWRDLTKVFHRQRRPFWATQEDDLAAEIMRAFLNAVA